MFLLFRIHAAVSFRQEFFCLRAILRINGEADAERKPVLAADFASCYSGEFAQAESAGFRRRRTETRRHDDKLVAAHTRNVVIIAARSLQGLGKKFQDAVTFQVPVTIVDLLETIK